MLEEASAQVAQQAEALDKLGSDSDSKAAELASAQKQLSSALASLESTKSDLSDQTELISSLNVENTGVRGGGGGGWGLGVGQTWRGVCVWGGSRAGGRGGGKEWETCVHGRVCGRGGRGCAWVGRGGEAAP